jgi:hypothetical protein
LAKCTAITRGGDRCKGIAIDSSDYCYAHHPDHADDRKRAARKGGKRGGRGRPQAELSDIKGLLEDLADRVLVGELPTGPAAVVNQLINTRLRAIEQARKIKETEDLETRIQALEDLQLAKSKGAHRWG